MAEQTVKMTIRVAGSKVVPLSATDPVQLACGPEGCRSTCCKNGSPIVLNPYEIARICSAADLSYGDFLDIADTERSEGFPLILLPRDPVCHFWTGTGCRIYQARPLACRLFPLGRVHENGKSHIVLPEQNRCAGLAAEPRKTLADYISEAETETYIRMADRWIEFVSAMERLSLPDRPVTSVAFHLLVYAPELPAAVGQADGALSIEDRYLLRLVTAQSHVPRYLHIA